MPKNKAQQACRDSAYSLVRQAADQDSFTLCFPADYCGNGELAISLVISRKGNVKETGFCRCFPAIELHLLSHYSWFRLQRVEPLKDGAVAPPSREFACLGPRSNMGAQLKEERNTNHSLLVRERCRGFHIEIPCPRVRLVQSSGRNAGLKRTSHR